MQHIPLQSEKKKAIEQKKSLFHYKLRKSTNGEIADSYAYKQ